MKQEVKNVAYIFSHEFACNFLYTSPSCKAFLVGVDTS